MTCTEDAQCDWLKRDDWKRGTGKPILQGVGEKR